MALSHSERNILALILANARILYSPSYAYDVATAMDTGPAPFTEQTARAMLIRYTRGDSVRGKVMSVGISRGNDAFRPDVDQAIGALHDQLVYEIGARKEFALGYTF